MLPAPICFRGAGKVRRQDSFKGIAGPWTVSTAPARHAERPLSSSAAKESKARYAGARSPDDLAGDRGRSRRGAGQRPDSDSEEGALSGRFRGNSSGHVAYRRMEAVGGGGLAQMRGRARKAPSQFVTRRKCLRVQVGYPSRYLALLLDELARALLQPRNDERISKQELLFFFSFFLSHIYF